MEIINDTSFKNYRLQQLEKVEKYPYIFKTSISFPEYIKKYNNIDIGSRIRDVLVSIAGRVLEVRNSGKNLYFYTVESDNYILQFLVDKREYSSKDSSFEDIVKIIHRGDIIGANGFVGKSIRGELSMYPTELKLLAPCLHHLPKQHFGFRDIEMRVVNRHLDLIINADSRATYTIRSKVVRCIRNYLEDLDFLEVHTPVLSSNVGGASAKPFITYHNDLKKSMYLRIAPELYLKKLIVGGFNKIYELGPQFRNESIDTTHNPEFWSLEYYMTYSDYNDLIKMCEDMLCNIIIKIKGNLKFEYNNTTIDFTPPFKRIKIVDELESILNVKFPIDFSSSETFELLDKLCKDHNIECSEPRTNARLLDKLIGKFLESNCTNPTFLMDHPLVMSPLAKEHRDNKYLTERFELFVCGMELANAYTELNDPTIQYDRFMEQQKAKNSGDLEAQLLDASFVNALEFGMPPTAGFGMGIDRFIMLLTDRNSIRDVILFPAIINKN